MERTLTEQSRLSDRAQLIKPAQTLAIAARATAMRKEGIDVVSFSTGEPDFNTPEGICAVGIEAITSGFTHYTDAGGIVELRRAVAEKFVAENGIPATAETVLVSSGGKHSIFNAMMAIINPGDEVIIPAPFWVSYPEIVMLLGGTPVILETSASDRYKVSLDQFRDAMTPKTKAIIINSPSNPTGTMYTPEELTAVGRLAADAGVYLISDELYEKIIYGSVPHFSPGSLPELADLAITINGVSKAWAMTGWRIGFMTGPADVVGAAAAIQSQTTSNPSSISQKAALEAILHGADAAEGLRQSFAKRRELMGSLLAEIPGIAYPIPDGAFYYFIDAEEYRTERTPNSIALAEHLLVNHHLAIVPGEAFGDDRGFRLSYACSDEDIRKGMERLARGLAELRPAQR